MIDLNEVESRLGLLAKHKKEWKRMGVNYSMELVEKGVSKKLRDWFENYWMEMVQFLQIRQGFQYLGY